MAILHHEWTPSGYVVSDRTESALYICLDVYRGVREVAGVHSLRDAVRVWTRLRDENGLGASDMARATGQVVDCEGTYVARVSYNGRLWEPDGEGTDELTADDVSRIDADAERMLGYRELDEREGGV